MSVTRTWLESQGAEFGMPAEVDMQAEFDIRFEPSTVVVSAHGELDAANADRLAECVAHCVTQRPSLVLDLSDLDFIGTAGFSALHRIHVLRSAAGASWAIVPSRAVSRLLRICDPDGVLPLVESTQRSEPGQPSYSS